MAGMKAKDQGDRQAVAEVVGVYGSEPNQIFWAPSRNKVLNESETEVFGGLQRLEKLTDGELADIGLQRFKLPKLKLETDDFSIRASIPGDATAWFHATVPKEGTVVLQFLNKGSLPDGSGGHFLAAALKAHGVLPSEKLILKNVVNKESVEAFKSGGLPQDTLVAKPPKL